ncbi:hypothetical protein Hamer_G030648 [Homarus americanus]|uniref:Uncharacterized protein n=1 Tax=Homarus americanus TaxID=6706 RepID=A0A8J5MZY1_HOMAM|nr:hypothetical protein Hamer_G030648 [Homarus americanus]
MTRTVCGGHYSPPYTNRGQRVEGIVRHDTLSEDSVWRSLFATIHSARTACRGSMESTRSKTEVWLIGQHITEITGAQLPSRGDVLRLFFHGHNEHKKTVNDSASEVAASVISFWNKARIPTITEKSIGRKVVDLFLMWKGLKKNCTRTTDTQRKKEETFCDELEDLFDVAHPKAMQLLTIKEDRAFLAAQREKGRRGVMAGVDKKIACSIKRREESKSKQSLQQNQASSALEYDELGSSSETESQSSSSSSTSSLAISPVVSSSNRKRATLKVITPELSSTLDRTGISHRSALRIVSATAASLGQRVEVIACHDTLSEDSVWRSLFATINYSIHHHTPTEDNMWRSLFATIHSARTACRGHCSPRYTQRGQRVEVMCSPRSPRYTRRGQRVEVIVRHDTLSEDSV